MPPGNGSGNRPGPVSVSRITGRGADDRVTFPRATSSRGQEERGYEGDKSKKEEKYVGNLPRFVRESIYRVSRTLSSKYEFRSSDESLRNEYTEKSLYHQRSITWEVDTKVIACPTWIRSEAIGTLPIPRFSTQSTTLLEKNIWHRPEIEECTLIIHVISVHFAVAVVYLTE